MSKSIKNPAPSFSPHTYIVVGLGLVSSSPLPAGPSRKLTIENVKQIKRLIFFKIDFGVSSKNEIISNRRRRPTQFASYYSHTLNPVHTTHARPDNAAAASSVRQLLDLS